MHRRRNRPMFFIDIAVPRDVDPAMNKLDGIFVYDIDDLQQVAVAHMEERNREASDAETLIAGEVERFHQRQRTVNLAPAIVALQRKAEEIRQAELHRIQARLGTLTPEQTAAVEALTRGLVTSFSIPPCRPSSKPRAKAIQYAWMRYAKHGQYQLINPWRQRIRGKGQLKVRRIPKNRERIMKR